MWVDKNQVQIITDETFEIARRQALLPYVLKALQYDRRMITNCPLKLTNHYLEILNLAIARCQKELNQNRRALFRRHIIMVDQNWLTHQIMMNGESFQLALDRDDAMKWINATAHTFLNATSY